VRISAGWSRPGASGRSYPALASLEPPADAAYAARAVTWPGSPDQARSYKQPFRGALLRNPGGIIPARRPGRTAHRARMATLPRGGYHDAPDISDTWVT